MKNNTKNIKNRLTIWATVVALTLLLPLILQFPWTIGDYIFAGVVLFGAATVFEVGTINMKNNTQRILTGAAVALIVFLIWGWAVA